MHGWQGPSDRQIGADSALTEPLLSLAGERAHPTAAATSTEQAGSSGFSLDDMAGKASHNSSTLGESQQHTARIQPSSRTMYDNYMQPHTDQEHQSSSDRTKSSPAGSEGAAVKAADFQQTFRGQGADQGAALPSSWQVNGTRLGVTAASSPNGSNTAHHDAIYLRCITATVLNAILAMAATASLLTHSLALALGEPNQQHQELQTRLCLGPEAAIFTHFVTLSLCLFSCSSAAISAIISHSNPRLAKVALWATCTTTAGSFCATIAALSFTALAQLGCTALGWVAFGLIIGLGGAAPLIFAGSIMICAASMKGRRREHRIRRNAAAMQSKPSAHKDSKQPVPCKPAAGPHSGNFQGDNQDSSKITEDKQHGSHRDKVERPNEGAQSTTGPIADSR